MVTPWIIASAMLAIGVPAPPGTAPRGAIRPAAPVLFDIDIVEVIIGRDVVILLRDQRVVRGKLLRGSAKKLVVESTEGELLALLPGDVMSLRTAVDQRRPPTDAASAMSTPTPPSAGPVATPTATATPAQVQFEAGASTPTTRPATPSTPSVAPASSTASLAAPAAPQTGGPARQSLLPMSLVISGATGIVGGSIPTAIGLLNFNAYQSAREALAAVPQSDTARKAAARKVALETQESWNGSGVYLVSIGGAVIVAGAAATIIGAWLWGSAEAEDEPPAPKPVGKFAFAAKDYALEYLEPGGAATWLKPRINEQVTSIVDMGERALPQALATVPPPISQAILALAKRYKSLIIEKVSGRILGIYDDNQPAVDAVIAKYSILGDDELKYDLIEAGSGKSKKVIDQANAALKETFRVSRSILIAKKLLVVARADAAAFQATNDLGHLAGVGVGVITITKLTMSAVVDAQALAPRLQQTSMQIAQQVQADPFLALDLGGAVQTVAGAAADLAGVPGQAGDLLTEVGELIQLFG